MQQIYVKKTLSNGKKFAWSAHEAILGCIGHSCNWPRRSSKQSRPSFKKINFLKKESLQSNWSKPGSGTKKKNFYLSACTRTLPSFTHTPINIFAFSFLLCSFTNVSESLIFCVPYQDTCSSNENTFFFLFYATGH